jgi:hypothetical protein
VRPLAELLGLLVGSFRPATAEHPKRYGAGLHPVDGRGQYVSPKPTSKRNRHAGVR